MKIVCFRCGQPLGEDELPPTQEIPVWYGCHPQCDELMSPFDHAQLVDKVKKQEAYAKSLSP